MKVDISEILKINGSSMQIDTDVDLSNIDYYGEKPFQNTRVKGTIANRSGIVTFKAIADVDISTNCARCLCDISLKRSFDIYETLVTQLEDDELESEGYTVVKNRQFDIADCVRDTVLLDIDMVFLCREDCMGLCPTCGADLNKGKCDCGKEEQQ